ncbi:MAG: class I SAM-dependent methyltransferase [Flavobacteriaceae bacterium]
MKKTDWFTDWFNTSYYHILYKNRNDEDAQLFMRNITKFLQISTNSYILDLPCGKGRHSIYLNSLGYKVTGADLSENSINYAKNFENDSLNFAVKDMRKPLSQSYDAIFNLFTSFGYFENDEDDILVLENIKNGLNEHGVMVLDFLNVVNVKKHLIPKEIKTVDEITFRIEREIKNGFILKHISFTDKGQDHSYTEKVKYIDLDKFETYFNSVGLKINHIFGDYQLSEFQPESSNRLIIVAS